jgi:hypothetical protein
LKNICKIEFIKPFNLIFALWLKKYRQSCLSSNKVLDAGAKVSVAKAPDG